MTHDEMIQRWRDHLGFSEWEVAVILDGYGDDEAAAEAMLEAFMTVCPEAGPVISMDGKRMTVAFGLAAATAEQASRLAEAAFVESAVASGIEAVSYAYEIKAEVPDGEAVPA